MIISCAAIKKSVCGLLLLVPDIKLLTNYKMTEQKLYIYRLIRNAHTLGNTAGKPYLANARIRRLVGNILAVMDDAAKASTTDTTVAPSDCEDEKKQAQVDILDQIIPTITMPSDRASLLQIKSNIELTLN